MTDGRRDGDPGLAPGEPRSFGNGRYTVRRRLGAGNFATVYEAYDERLDVPVAVKLLSDRWSWEPEVRGRFVQEARLLRSLNDARVVQIRDIAETDDGRPYLVMDLATSGTLEQRLIELAQRGVRPDARQLRAVAAAMADALGVLHERRIAHRDIKPSNILITARGSQVTTPEADPPVLLRPGEQLMLGDLGLAKDLSFDSGVTVGVGTAGYMAPEQALAGAKVDTRTDIYAVSALLAQIASGEAPDPMRRISNGAVQSGRPLPPTIPSPLDRALGHGLDADPALRTQTIEQWHAEVDAALAALDPEARVATPAPAAPAPATAAPASAMPPPVSGPGVTIAAPAGPSPQRSSRRVGIIAAAALVVAGLVGVILATRGGDDPGAGASTTVPAAVTSTTSGTTTTSSSTSTTSTTVTTLAPTTVAPTNPPVVALPTVTIVPPAAVHAGVQAMWGVQYANAVSGTWSLVGGSVSMNNDAWSPGDGFQGTWPNAGETVTLTLTVVDDLGHQASDTVTFTVEP